MSTLVPREKLTAAEKFKVINKTIDSLNKKAGANIINYLSDPDTRKKLTIEYIPFPSLKLNAMCGGLPKGRLSIIGGLPDSGKTSLILETIGLAMKNDPDFIAFWLESEKSLEIKALTEVFGIDPERFIYVELQKGTPAEKVLDIMEAAIETGGLDIAVINSLKCLTPKKEFEDSMEDQNIGLQARLNSKLMRKIVPLLAETETALCVTQHLSTQIGILHGDPMTLSGGYAIKFAALLILDLRKKSIQKEDPITKEEGSKIGVHVLKNHCNQIKYPYVRGDYYIRFGEGTQIFTEIIELAIENGVLNKGGGGWITEIDPTTGDAKVLEDGSNAKWQGMNKLKDYLESNPKYYDYLKSSILEDEIKIETLDEEDLKIAEELNNSSEEDIESILEEADKEAKKTKKKASTSKKK